MGSSGGRQTRLSIAYPVQNAYISSRFHSGTVHVCWGSQLGG